MTRRQIPSLMALRAFEAAARLGSFTGAASELCLTQSAISRHVRNLEQTLKILLFHRNGRRLALTSAGREYLSATGDAFDRIALATARLDPNAPRKVLGVSMLASIAVKWFSARLGKFSAAFPDIDLRINTSRELVDFDRDGNGIDVAIRYGPGGWPGVDAEEITREEIMPVCSPHFLSGLHPLREPADLAKVPLLHGPLRQDWVTWLRGAGCDSIDAARGPWFDDAAAMIQAAVDGLGVALGRTLLIADDVQQNRLVIPFEHRLIARWNWWFVTRRGRANEFRIRAFRNWLVAEIRSSVRSITTSTHTNPGKKHGWGAEASC